METYTEKSRQVAQDAQIAVLLVSNPEYADLEVIPLKPHPMPESERDALKARWPGRNLRSIGVVGIRGTTPLAAFKEPLPPQVVNALAAAFLEYIRVLLGDSFARQMETVEIAELERIYAYSDLSAPAQ